MQFIKNLNLNSVRVFIHYCSVSINISVTLIFFHFLHFIGGSSGTLELLGELFDGIFVQSVHDVSDL